MENKMQKSIIDYIGSTPTVYLENISKKIAANIFLKLEYLNPWLSVKDRIAKNIIETAEREGRLLPGGHVIEATSGNTGISLAGICAVKGYKLTIVMPEFVSEERKLLLAMMGVNLIFTPESQGLLGPVAKSLEIADKDPKCFLVNQTRNPGNPDAHLETGKEIWQQMAGKVDCFISASGTGGHLSGIGKYLKEQNSDVEIIAVEPIQAAVLSGQVDIGEADANHGIVGIGPGFIPETLDRNVIDRVSVVNVDDCYKTAEYVIKNEGLLIGVSTGAVLKVALEVGSLAEYFNKNIVVVAASSTERYLSTPLSNNARIYVRSRDVISAEESYIKMLCTGQKI
ncbi:hypothetical protein PN36_27355 [Candidatus Thiomargarita nelsonii]|uniref:Cysteine synthase B n=1 Tax=Candidatus Thiomargarita nelsonii TaxID=1003181 RepID=A0A4E0RP66_9GAMM|nr:hypothetical protein PN36_27355 [Candidatus Thiomargarita nelsonii]